MPYSIEQQILNKKIGLDKKGVPYYLYLLNLNFGENEQEKESSLNKFRQLAFELKNRPRIVKKLILSENWRPALVGNATALFSGNKTFQKDLIWRLENGNWVAPQIAVGIALLDEGNAKKELGRIIENASEDSNPKTVISTYSSLKFLESRIASEFEKTKMFEFLKEKDSWDNSITIATEHWNFWKNIKPIN